MQSQCQETDHLDPVVTLVQMGTFMLENMLPGLTIHAHGNVDLGLNKTKDKSGVDLVTLPTTSDTNGFLNFRSQLHVGNQTVNTKADGYDDPYPGEKCRYVPAGKRKLRLKTQITADLNRHQQTDTCQQP